MNAHHPPDPAALARHIAELADRHKLLVPQDLPLSERLSQLPAGNRIPDPVFAALAAVLGFLQHEDELESERLYSRAAGPDANN